MLPARSLTSFSENMRRRIQEILSKRYPARVWTVIIFILLALPGDMLPSETHTDIPNLDKIVHIILFGCFVFLWSVYYAATENRNTLNRKVIIIFVVACLYGTAMEYIQKYFIPNRDFDIYDIAADIIGAALGLLAVRMTVMRFRTS
jgi:VanZ family protein